MITNIVNAYFQGEDTTQTRGLYQWDYGQVLRLRGLALPASYEVHFSNVQIGGESVTQIGNADGVNIPDALLTTGRPVFAWVFLHAGENDGETMYAVQIPVTKRPQPSDEQPTPVEQSAIAQAIAALNAAVITTGQDVTLALQSAEDAEQAAEDAEQAADRAEQAAATAGFIDIDIVNGCLVYTRTDTIDVDFELVNGDLIVEVG